MGFANKCNNNHILIRIQIEKLPDMTFMQLTTANIWTKQIEFLSFV